MDKAKSAACEFSLRWQSEVARHHERFFAPPIRGGQDALPRSMKTFAAGELVPTHAPARVVTFATEDFATNQRGMTIEPRCGRFYPQSLARAALGCEAGNALPFRIIGKTDATLSGDCNHPLSRYPLTLQTGNSGTVKDIAAMVTANGPGMQAPYPGVATDFYSCYPFTRMDGRKDSLFYASKRLVQHLDSTARQQVAAIYQQVLQPGMKVLDLMSSWVSHLPDFAQDLQVTGLGMNAEELAANPQLHQQVVHDLNRNPQLPFDDNAFDAVICTVSVEYLIQPLEIMQELARITRTGGVVAMTFSDRWFPGKVITLWAEMHPFERQGLVLDYFLQTGRFTDLHTESVRGLPRPAEAPRIRAEAVSDPVFAVWGSVACA